MPTAALAVPAREIYTVTRLNQEARSVLESTFPPIWLEGEMSNLARPSSGHLYFSLKDAQCQVRCAMFRNRNLLLNFTAENGMHVLVYAQIGLYEGRGDFQLIVEHMEPAGDGALRLALERLKQKLHADGLFSDGHKIDLPAIPRCIGVATSPTGAALRDILSILRRRFPAIPVVIYPVPVQGAGAAAAIARAIARADQRKDCDVLILARGGGSLEDLWAFNEEIVARAIYTCDLPVVTGIGHEIDFTIADLVADRRAATPSAAAELVSPDGDQVLAHLAALERRLLTLARMRLNRLRDSTEWLSKRLVQPGRRLQDLTQRLDELSLRLSRAARGVLKDKAGRIAQLSAGLHRHTPQHSVMMRATQYAHLHRRLANAAHQYLARLQGQLASLIRALHAVSPLATLERGYAIVTTVPKATVVSNAAELTPGDCVAARLAKGRIQCIVEETFDDAPD